MEGQEYLNQISATSKPMAVKKEGLFSSKLFIWIMIALAALVFIVIIGSIIGSGKGGEKDLGYALRLHLTNTGSAINTYQENIKSSELRSNSASLYSVLSNTNRELSNYLSAKYKIKDSDIDKKIVAEATTAFNTLSTELFQAKINGILDRVFAHKMAYEITLLLSEEKKLIEVSKNEALDEALTTSYKSLENLYPKFNDFSETKTIRKE